jgi:SAM-dependent methyltransferase
VSFDFQGAYDELNAGDHDYRFYADLADELGARRVLDLGCGTGTLARLMAAAGRAVVGIDPDPEMLRVARGKPGAEKVDWRLGFSDRADTASVDLAVMSGHVAQLFVEDDGWAKMLGDLHRALSPGGILAFETRNPSAKGWERWTREFTLRTVATDEGPVEFWHHTVEVALPLVTYDTHTRNVTTGAATCTRDVLAFRNHDAVTHSLRLAGFEPVSVFGDWSKSGLCEDSPEIIVTARRR